VKKYSLGIDLGSVSTNIVLVDSNKQILKKLYLKTSGNPIQVIMEESLESPLNILWYRLFFFIHIF
jgi:activator of 2-hydroxyglutaryl-CoA dehydratase